MESLLGFIVLTGPLFLIVLWVPASIALAFWVGRKMVSKSRWLKVISGLAIFLFTLLLPVTDFIVDRAYIKYLCENKQTVQVFHSLALPVEFRDENDQQLLINSIGRIDYRLLGQLFEWDMKDEVYPSILAKIHKRTWLFIDKRNNKPLAEKVSFHSDGGWIECFSPAPGRGASCRSIELNKYGENEYFRQVDTKERYLFSEIFLDLGVEYGNNN